MLSFFLVIGLSSIVSTRFDFQDLIFSDMTSMLSFIAQGRLHGLLISFYLPFSSMFSHLILAFIAVRVSGGSPIHQMVVVVLMLYACVFILRGDYDLL
ncbi:hypothetical protein IGI04_035643, partial [Brassica rapa subsp. trilocularis]